MASIISSLKYDFTGYNVDPLDLIKMKINDIHSKENKIKLLEAVVTIDSLIENGF